ncbi:helix-turn-helix transcriptional regulator [Trabulsiella odontotermitis]|uniref:helix-turn-helix domain-containing protein n=1 Tax=Trabulsiella odontotermitis TaxID=379893 RepID=UPI0024B757A7|nr:helix-turn-helix transcriptional regulator [Trabulsiella odontotermitis]WHP32816.1 helix-turn-helix transcriptional regulator [Trabulsiella odontotermitis]
MQSPLRTLRKTQGFTLSQVASAVAIDPANLSRIERGQQIASLDVTERLVTFFAGQIDELQILYPHRYVKHTDGK